MKLLATLFILVWLIPVIIGIISFFVAKDYNQASACFLFALLLWVVGDRLG